MTPESTAISRLEIHLGRVLLTGVLSSASLLAAGLVLWLAGTAPALGTWLLTAGLFLLMATPMVRVIVSLAEYVRMRDWFFATTTVAVLLVLAATVAYALLEK
jgi:uncharacterized membrane protein